MKSFALPKSRHLYGELTVATLFKEGKAFLAFPLRIVYRIEKRREENHSRPTVRSMFAASKKHYKHAVDRNRYKRLMREAYRLQQNVLIDYLDSKALQLDVSFNTISPSMPNYKKVSSCVEKAINTIIKQIEKEDNNSTTDE